MRSQIEAGPAPPGHNRFGKPLFFLRPPLEFDRAWHDYPRHRVVERDVHHQLHDAAVIEEGAQRVESDFAYAHVAGRLLRITHHRPLLGIERWRGRVIGKLFELVPPYSDPERDVPMMHE